MGDPLSSIEAFFSLKISCLKCEGHSLEAILQHGVYDLMKLSRRKVFSKCIIIVFWNFDILEYTLKKSGDGLDI